ncbi:MAG TPA: hypothetical protein VEA18_03380 [Candidatus Kapabacteria bacterium]|nr:hypothetical protein [Candidatus Kapabacteria bacterium]
MLKKQYIYIYALVELILLLLALGVYLLFRSEPSHESTKTWSLVTSTQEFIFPDVPTPVTFFVLTPNGDVARHFDIVHEKALHLIAVRQDLQWFEHIHPVFNTSTGEFSTMLAFPTDGPYRLFADFRPTESDPQVIPFDISVGDPEKYIPERLHDMNTVVMVDDYEVTLNIPKTIYPNTDISYSVTIKREGKEVTDMEPYLGAKGHSVIVREDTLDYLHIHPDSDTLSFHTSFPSYGIYRIFIEFKHRGIVHTAAFTVMTDMHDEPVSSSEHHH